MGLDLKRERARGFEEAMGLERERERERERGFEFGFGFELGERVWGSST